MQQYFGLKSSVYLGKKMKIGNCYVSSRPTLTTWHNKLYIETAIYHYLNSLVSTVYNTYKDRVSVSNFGNCQAESQCV